MTEISAKPRVLILATRVPLESGDGTPSFVLDNATALTDEFDITILAPRIRGSRAVSRHGDVTVKRFPYCPVRWERLADDAIMPQLGDNPLLWLQAVPLVGSMLWHTRKEHRKKPIALIHANWILPAGLVAAVMNSAYSIPFLTTSHGADAFRLNHWPFGAIKRSILNRSFRFIGVSREIIEKFPTRHGRVELQPVGTDFTRWGPTRPHANITRWTVLFVGRLSEKKGVADAIRAVARLDGFELRIVGAGQLENDLRFLAKSLRCDERVVFLGRMKQTEVGHQMRSAHCLVIPSVTAKDGDRDGTPTVLGEAIAAQLPVVASNIAGLAEFIVDDETGRLYEPGDVDGLAAALQSLASRPEVAAQLALEARSRFAQTFDLQKVALRHVRWYQEAIGKS